MGRIVTVGEHTPDIHPDAFVADTAVVAGNVVLAAGANVWFGTVIRSEYERVRVGVDTNVQDLTTIHADPAFPVTLGDRVTVGHRCVIHGCTIEDDALIGMGAVVMNGAVIGAGSVVGAGAVVTEGTEVPPRSLVVGVPGRVLEGKQVPEGTKPNVAAYTHFAELYRAAQVEGGA